MLDVEFLVDREYRRRRRLRHSRARIDVLPTMPVRAPCEGIFPVVSASLPMLEQFQLLDMLLERFLRSCG